MVSLCRAEKVEKSTPVDALVGALVGPLVDPLVATLVGTLVGQLVGQLRSRISLPPALCVAHPRTRHLKPSILIPLWVMLERHPNRYQ